MKVKSVKSVCVWSRPKDMEAASDSAQLSAQDSTQRACDLALATETAQDRASIKPVLPQYQTETAERCHQVLMFLCGIRD